MNDPRTLVLRLAGPLQAWSSSSQFNLRNTDDRPTKAGIIGLLAAAQGRRRGDDITDLIGLQLAVRVDQPGSLLQDYHTVSSLNGDPLPAAKVNAKGWQQGTSPKKFTHVTRRMYLQDAVFVAFVQGDAGFIGQLASAVRRPKYALALGRRSCVPTQPLVLASATGDTWPDASLDDLVRQVPWQAGRSARSRVRRSVVSVSATVDDRDGDDLVGDVPVTFDQRGRRYLTRRVRHLWVDLATGIQAEPDPADRDHDPFALLGW